MSERAGGADFIVIGAGIAGASAAHELAVHGRVVMVERERQAGYHTTGRSAAQFLGSYGNLTTRRLTRAGRSFFESPPDGFTDVPLLHPRGALFFAREDQRQSLHALYDEVSRLSPNVSLLSAEETRSLAPALREGYAIGAMHEPDSMDIDVNALHQGYLRGARGRGAVLVTDAPVDAIAREGKDWVVTTARGEFRARALINAAGAWCDEVATLAGARPIGLVPKRRTVITFPAPAIEQVERWPLTIDVDEQFYFKPESGRLLASPADETPSPPCDAQPEELDIALVVDRLERATTLAVTRIESRWAGLRSFVPDKSLVIGEDDELEGFFWVSGQGGYGIQTSRAVSLAIAGIVTAGDLPASLREHGLASSDLSPARLR